MASDFQTRFDVGVVMTTVVRAKLVQAVQSVFAQQFGGRIRVLIGIDRWQGDRAAVEQLQARRPSHVGAQACVCRGMLSYTIVGDDARIGSLVYVSHGVEIGERAWLSAGPSIAGHATIGTGALLGMGSVVVDNVRLEPGVVSGAGTVVTRDTAAARACRACRVAR